MSQSNQQILDYWNREDVESMYDKNLLNAEIESIRHWISPSSKVLDAGCGEGEGTVVYSSVPGVLVHAVDFSETRLRKAAESLAGRKNVTLKQVDFLGQYVLDSDYDCIVSQRFLINLTDPVLQEKVLVDLVGMLKVNGKFLLLEGSQQGVDSLNEFREACQLQPIPVKWHNLFFHDDELIEVMQENGCKLLEVRGFGTYFLLTRGVRPLLDSTLNWDSDFNRLAASQRLEDELQLGTKFSRLKLWVFEKVSNQ